MYKITSEQQQAAGRASEAASAHGTEAACDSAAGRERVTDASDTGIGVALLNALLKNTAGDESTNVAAESGSVTASAASAVQHNQTQVCVR